MVEVLVHLVKRIPCGQFHVVARIARVELLIRLDGTWQVGEAVHIEEAEMIETVGDERIGQGLLFFCERQVL